MIEKFKPIAIKIALIFLSFAAIIAVFQGFKNALTFSGDFQWSPTVLFWQKINPYLHYLSGNEDGALILMQVPNYAHLTYLLLGPFALVSWDTAKPLWAILNILLSISCVLFLCRHCKLRFIDFYIILMIFLCSTPFRNVIGNGQQTMIVLFAYCSLFIKRDHLSSFLSGFLYFKYSFMFPLAFFILLKKGVKCFLLSGIACGLGWIIFSLVVNESPLITLMQPLKVSSISVSDGTADVMTIVSFFGFGAQSVYFIVGSYLIPIVLSFFIALYAMKRADDPLFVVAIMAIGSLIGFKHVRYDFVLLLPAFIYAYTNRRLMASKLAIILIFYNWFGLKLIWPLEIRAEILVPINFLACVCIFLCLNKIQSRTVHL